MLKPILDLGKRVLTLTQDGQKSKEDIKELQSEVKEIAQKVQVLAFELQR